MNINSVLLKVLKDFKIDDESIHLLEGPFRNMFLQYLGTFILSELKEEDGEHLADMIEQNLYMSDIAKFLEEISYLPNLIEKAVSNFKESIKVK